jgi:hypothetical protein
MGLSGRRTAQLVYPKGDSGHPYPRPNRSALLRARVTHASGQAPAWATRCCVRNVVRTRQRGVPCEVVAQPVEPFVRVGDDLTVSDRPVARFSTVAGLSGLVERPAVETGRLLSDRRVGARRHSEVAFQGTPVSGAVGHSWRPRALNQPAKALGTSFPLGLLSRKQPRPATSRS